MENRVEHYILPTHVIRQLCSRAGEARGVTCSNISNEYQTEKCKKSCHV